MTAPVIDVVRIAPDGTGIVAGRAMAGAAVSVMLDDLLVAEVVADASGSFAAFVTLPASDQPRTISLIADPAGTAVGSDATVIVAPSPVAEPPRPAPGVPDVIALADAVTELPETILDPVPETVTETLPEPISPVAVEPTAVAPDPPGPSVAQTQQAAPADSLVLTETVIPETVPPESVAVAPPPAQTQSSAQTEPSAPEQPRADTPDPAPELTDTVAALPQPVPDAPGVAPVLRMDEAGVRVLQPAIAPGATPEVLATVALDAIAYDAAGDVQLSGRATGGG